MTSTHSTGRGTRALSTQGSGAPRHAGGSRHDSYIGDRAQSRLFALRAPLAAVFSPLPFHLHGWKVPLLWMPPACSSLGHGAVGVLSPHLQLLGCLCAPGASPACSPPQPSPNAQLCPPSPVFPLSLSRASSNPLRLCGMLCGKGARRPPCPQPCTNTTRASPGACSALGNARPPLSCLLLAVSCSLAGDGVKASNCSKCNQ